MDNKMVNYRQFLIDRLGYFRTKAKLSCRELSLMLGFSEGYITKFEKGAFSIPAEVLLEAISICGTTPEEFFSANISNFAEHRELNSQYDKLSPESKQNILDIMKNLK